MKRTFLMTLLLGMSAIVVAQKEMPATNADSSHGKPLTGSTTGPKPAGPDQGAKPVKDGSLSGPWPGANPLNTGTQKDAPMLGPKPGANGPNDPRKDAPMLGPKPPAADQPTGKPTKDSLKGEDPKKQPVIIKPVKQ